MSDTEHTADHDILAATFAARVQLAKETEEECVGKARAEWERAQQWVRSSSQRDGSFLWYCEEFDLDPSAVRRAIREKRR